MSRTNARLNTCFLPLLQTPTQKIGSVKFRGSFTPNEDAYGQTLNVYSKPEPIARTLKKWGLHLSRQQQAPSALQYFLVGNKEKLNTLLSYVQKTLQLPDPVSIELTNSANPVPMILQNADRIQQQSEGNRFLVFPNYREVAREDKSRSAHAYNQFLSEGFTQGRFNLIGQSLTCISLAGHSNPKEEEALLYCIADSQFKNGVIRIVD